MSKKSMGWMNNCCGEVKGADNLQWTAAGS